MKKLFNSILVAALAVCMLASCSSTESADNSSDFPVVLGKDGIPRPEWVVADTSTADVIRTAGYGNLATMQNSLKKAEAEGRNQIAEYVSATIDEVMVIYMNDAGEGADRQALDAFERIAKQEAKAVLKGVKREAFWVDAEGGVWVLMGMPAENVKQALEEASAKTVEQKFTTNEAADTANEKMDAAISKYFSIGTEKETADTDRKDID